MVLQQVAPRVHAHSPDASRPDPVRIIGITGTLAFNAMLLTVLLLPATRPPVVDTRPDAVLALRWLTPPPPTPPRPPERVEITTPKPVPVQAPTPVAPRIAVPVDVPVIVGHHDLAAPGESHVVNTVGVEAVAEPAPLAGVTLAYAHAPAPAYPRPALLAGAEGVVVLEVHVGRDGQPLDVRLHRSSGHRDLDRAALRHVQRTWQFQPAMRDGVPVEAIGLVPIAFNLSGG
ncbi:energy transducer TonB [Luteimonas sp. WGS1318]|uniref:energy transducer TonB n=1 Tax=Luteimonas sp. WGS1318 TaxID=3366815 RepID=UPI00372D5D50